MRQELRMSQQLVMTPQLQQAIKLLQLSRPELSDLVRNELLENPLLEEQQEIGTSTEEEPQSSVEMQDAVDARPADSMVAAPEPERQEVQAEQQSAGDEFDWEAYIRHQSLAGSAPGTGVRPESDLPGVDQTVSRPESLVDHLMWQVRLSGWSELDEEIAEYLIRSLSPAGYLHHVSVVQVARTLGTSTLGVEQVLRRVQALDPLSIGARNLAEALWIQVCNPEQPIEDPLVRALIAEHLPDLEGRKYPQIARDTGESLEEVYEATKLVMALEPRPARSFVSEAPQYVTPDVYVHKIGDEYVVTLNDDGLPKLRISNYYRAALAADPKAHGGAEAKAKDYITERLRSAQWLIRSIQQRQRTILKVTRSILKFQREFFEKGPQFLRPLILRDVAVDIEMHESTVSRVTTNKYVHTPQGIFELKYFFNAGIARRDGSELASEAVKEKIRRLIAAEDTRKPYSDQKLVDLLREEGIDIARRTVAKYREQLSVLSSAKRRKFF
jgi:RNA polymerase sigma-54 factor